MRDEDPQGFPVPFDHLADAEVYSPISWFGEDNWYMQLPEARLTTFRTAPTEVLNAFGRKDNNVGLDYEPAVWLSTIDTDAIIAMLEDLGHDVVSGHEAERVLSCYDYTDGQ